MKRYLFITSTNFASGRLTGAHFRLLELIRGIVRSNRVTLVSFGVPQLECVENIDHIMIKKVAPSFLPAHLQSKINISRILKSTRIDYDYAISFGGVNHTDVYRSCGYKNVISIFREDLINYLKISGTPKFKLVYFAHLERQAVKYSDKIILQNENDKSELLRRTESCCPDAASKIYIQINNINASWMQYPAVSRKRRDGSAVRIAFIGNFNDRRKGHAILIPAVKWLIDSGLNVELVVAGDGKELEQYRLECRDYSSIVFKGRVSNVFELLSESDIVVVPSLLDSCPNTVLEGISAGAAVYGSNRGGIPSLLKDEKYLFEPDEESLYKKLYTVITDGSYIQDAVDQQEIKCALTFDWAQRIEEIIEN